MNRYILFFIAALISLLSFANKDQHSNVEDYIPYQTISDSIEHLFTHKYDFIKADNQVIDTFNSLDNFYGKLYKIRTQTDTDTKVNILHIGDSHLQCGYLTNLIMNNFHIDFGNGGRGFIAPYKLAGTNGPIDYAIISDADWIGDRCSYPKNGIPFSIGAIGIETVKNQYNIKIWTKSQDNNLCYKFDKLTVFHTQQMPPLDVDKRFKDNLIKIETDSLGISTTYIFDKQLDTIVLISPNNPELKNNQATTSEQTSRKILYGFLLEKKCSGVIYNMIAANGAKFEDYNKITGFARNTSLFNSSLIIISLGTNESLGSSFNKTVLTKQIDSLIQSIQKSNPQASILLTTPAQTFATKRINGKYVKIKNPKTSEVSSAIIEYATEHKLAYWDLYELSGANGSADSWKKNELLGKDKLHFNINGYKLQGELLYQAIINGYNEYASRKNR